MKVRACIIAGATLLAWHGLALGQESADKTKRWTAEQPKVNAWFGEWEVGGQIDAEGVYRRPDAGDNIAGAGVAEAVLGVEAAVNDWIGGEVGLLYETVNIGLDDGEDSTSSAIDVATLTVGAPEGLWSLTAGRQYTPFGVFATNLISDPLTLELGETNELVLQFGLSSGGLHGSIFGFYGNKDQNGGYGAAIGYSLERSESEFGLNLSYISDIGASDGLQGAIADTRGRNNMPGWTASAELGYKDASLIGEYLASRKRFAGHEVEFAGRGAQSSSWLLEAACAVSLAGKEATVVAGYQGTGKALALELPTRRLLAGLSVELTEWFTPAIEWAHDEDYASKEGGNGEQASTITVQFAAEF